MTRTKPPALVAEEPAEVRAFPRRLEAERAILGAALQWPDEVFARVGELRGCWYRPDHEALWALLCEMRDEGAPVDLVTVPDRVGRTEANERGDRVPREPGRFGGVGYVTELPDHAPAWANVGYYAGLVREDARRRAVIAACQAAVERAYRGTEAVETVVDELVAVLAGVCE